jgi:succinate dehydrogenase / fumarate reductase membrane anchor subunit
MTTATTTYKKLRKVDVPRTYGTWAWILMRYSAVLLIPLVWIHVLIQDVLVGVHSINLNYVSMRWAILGWRIYDIALLSFAFAHGMNGLRNVLSDYVSQPALRRAIDWVLLIGWLLITAIGAVAVIGGVRAP